MFSGVFSYPYAVFRSDLRALGAMLEKTKIHRINGEIWNADDYEGETAQTLKISSYFTECYSDKSQSIELYGVFMMALSQIQEHIDVIAPGHDMDDLIDSGFDLASEPLLQAIHALGTEIDMFEWGDDRAAIFDFVLEIARTRFGYDG